jgi:histidine triad (HIT) family protein
MTDGTATGTRRGVRLGGERPVDDCIFCRIARGDLPAQVVWESEEVIAFEDVSPQAPVHTLVIPRRHFEHLGDDIPSDVLLEVFAAVPVVAAVKGIADSGYRIVVNNGPESGQTVPHLHVHIMGGAPLSHAMARSIEGC